MDGVEKKCNNCLKGILFSFLGIFSVSLLSFAAPSKKMHEEARDNVASLQRHGESGSRISVQHGLIAAKENLPGNFNWVNASGACDRLEENGYKDWHLPNKDELNKLYLARTLIGGFSDDRYWSSTEYDQKYALGQQFLDGSQKLLPKVDSLSVRPVRTF